MGRKSPLHLNSHLHLNDHIQNLVFDISFYFENKPYVIISTNNEPWQTIYSFKENLSEMLNQLK